MADSLSPFPTPRAYTALIGCQAARLQNLREIAGKALFSRANVFADSWRQRRRDSENASTERVVAVSPASLLVYPHAMRARSSDARLRHAPPTSSAAQSGCTLIAACACMRWRARVRAYVRAWACVRSKRRARPPRGVMAHRDVDTQGINLWPKNRSPGEPPEVEGPPVHLVLFFTRRDPSSPRSSQFAYPSAPGRC